MVLGLLNGCAKLILPQCKSIYKCVYFIYQRVEKGRERSRAVPGLAPPSTLSPLDVSRDRNQAGAKNNLATEKKLHWFELAKSEKDMETV